MLKLWLLVEYFRTNRTEWTGWEGGKEQKKPIKEAAGDLQCLKRCELSRRESCGFPFTCKEWLLLVSDPLPTLVISQPLTQLVSWKLSNLLSVAELSSHFELWLFSWWAAFGNLSAARVWRRTDFSKQPSCHSKFSRYAASYFKIKKVHSEHVQFRSQLHRLCRSTKMCSLLPSPGGQNACVIFVFKFLNSSTQDTLKFTLILILDMIVNGRSEDKESNPELTGTSLPCKWYSCKGCLHLQVRSQNGQLVYFKAVAYQSKLVPRAHKFLAPHSHDKRNFSNSHDTMVIIIIIIKDKQWEKIITGDL